MSDVYYICEHGKRIDCPDGLVPDCTCMTEVPTLAPKPQKKPLDLQPVKVYIGKSKRRFKWQYMDLIFDSKDEALRYGYLYTLQDTGIISHLRVQPTAVLRPSFVLDNPFYVMTQHGKPRSLQSETYTPDYAYLYNGLMVIEDVKGLKREKVEKKGVITYKEYPYSKQNSDRSQKYLLYRYRNRHHVVFVLTCHDNGTWRYFQASQGYPELSFQLTATGLEQAA